MAAFIAFKGDVMRLTIGNESRNDDSNIALQVYHFSKSSKSFRRVVDKVLPHGISTSSELEFLSAKCLLNTTSGLYQPCLLLRQAPIKRDIGEELHVLLLESYDSVSLLGSFEFNHTETSHIEFHLIDGPAVCWTLEGVVYFARFDSTIEKFTVDSLSFDNSMNEQASNAFHLLWCGILHSEMVAMGAKSEMTDDDPTLLQTRWTCVNHSRSDIEEIPLVPDLYVTIAACCFVRETSEELRFGRSDSVYDGLGVFLATNRGQLLEFVNGRLNNCCQLPFNDPCRIWILESEPDEVMVLVASQMNKICAVNCKKKQVVKGWDEIESVLIDDFLENGSEQILFLLHKLVMSETGELSKFSLIDVAKGMAGIETNQDSFLPQSQPVTDSLQKTAQALRTRLQARASSLYEAKMECHEKLKLLEHCCKVLKDVTSSSHSSSSEGKGEKNPRLYRLLEGAFDEDEQHAPPTKVLSSGLTVKEIWQRIVYEQWIVGIDVENTGESAVSDLVLGLVSCHAEGTSYSSKTAFYSDNIRHHKQPGIPESAESYSDSKSPAVKRKRTEDSKSTNNQKMLPGNLTRLTAVSSLPRFVYSSSCSLSVMVTWTSHCNGNFDQHSMCCGLVTLDTEEIMKGSVNVNRCLDHKSIQQDIAALRSVSIETELVLQSSVSRTNHLTSLVKSSMRDVPVVQIETADHKDIFSLLLPVLHDEGPLGGAGIVLKDDLKEGQVTLVTRNKNQAFLLLHRLRQVLPHDVRIRADSALELSSVKNSLCALNHEATHLQQNLRKLMEKANISHLGLESGQKRKDDCIKAAREGFERKRERESLGREEIFSEEEDVARLWSDCVEDQMLTDSVVARI